MVGGVLIAPVGDLRAEPAGDDAEAGAGDSSGRSEGPEGPAGSEASEGEGEASEGEASDAPEPAAEASAGAAAERPPMIEVVPKDKRIRHDWYIGFGWGGGVGLVRGQTLTHGVGFGTSGFLHAGGRIRDPLHAGVRLSTLTGGGYGASSILAEFLTFPLSEKGLIIGAAVGPSLIYPVTSTKGMNMAVANGKVGLAIAFEIGYDFWILRRFNIGLLARADGALRPGTGGILTGTFGLSFNWY